MSTIIKINKCPLEPTPTESYEDATLLYINNKLSGKPRQDLCIYKFCKLESNLLK